LEVDVTLDRPSSTTEYFILSRVKDSKVICVADEDALEEACAQQSVEV